MVQRRHRLPVFEWLILVHDLEQHWSDESHNANSTRELEKARGSPSGPLSPGSLHEFGEASSKSSSYMIHVDCRSTNRGLFPVSCIIAGIAASNPLSIIVNTASMVQVILQTTFIFDGLRRCSNNRELQRRKPGREMITFLAVCNVAMWTFSTFEIKRSETNPSQMLFYGSLSGVSYRICRCR
ncbi:hypothetical protein BV898_17564 [Hypsibius exemplaris]|uniref:Uncharacterized protein n=1 Tax=Hypsibius exemplaris TaxID=2072580 RepID=A0A9X6NI96_HYPEX|nr:hypothetical protein BV898_17564 [Hypsibius exemplaris]